MRIGGTTTVDLATADGLYTRTLHHRHYELKDHLGNVRAVVTDLKLSTFTTDNAPYYYEPEVLAATAYYPFGMDMAGQTASVSGKYRYGFNGKEKDLSFGSTHYDYGFRIYKPSIGKFLSVDPLTSSYPWYTPYQFAGNKPIVAIDLDGLEAKSSVAGKYIDGHWVMGSDHHISLEHEADLKMRAEYAAKHKPYIPNYGEIKQGGITGTSEYKTFEANVEAYADYFVPYELMKKYARGEDISAFDIGVEVVGLIPIGKFGRLLKFSDKAMDLIKVSKKLNPCGCFDSLTLVLIDSGYMAIDKIDIGQRVWSWDEKKHIKELRLVTDVFHHQRDTLYQVGIGNEIINVTSDHPIYSNGRWTSIKNLHIGEYVELFSGEKAEVESIEFRIGDFKVYNFTVDEFHTYFVSRNSLLVHNGTCDIFFGKNMMTKFRKHAAEIIAAARKQGIELSSGVGKEAVQDAFKEYLQTAVKNGESYVAEYMTMGEVIWTKYGDSIILRKKDGEFITHLTTGTKRGKETLQHWNDIVSKSTKAVNLTE